MESSHHTQIEKPRPSALGGQLPPKRSPERLASLDGFRAISIAMVIGSHALGTENFPSDIPIWVYPFINGDFGVRVFFVISGFLISTLLLREEKSHGSISLSLFYKRRALRILPVYFAYLLAVIGFAAAAGLSIPLRRYLEYLTFTTAWFNDEQWVIGHSWSLSVEEAFYLAWPFILTRLFRNRRIWAAVACIVSGPIIRAFNYKFGISGGHHFVWVNADAIMWGCLLALLHHHFSDRLSVALRKNVLLYHGLAAAGIFGLRWAFNHRLLGLITVPFTLTFDGLAIAYLLYYYSFISKGLVFRFLNWAPVVAVGVLSYSLYLWQELFLFPKDLHYFAWQTFPFNVLCCLGAAALSYYCWELPFLKLRAKLRHPAPGSLSTDSR